MRLSTFSEEGLFGRITIGRPTALFLKIGVKKLDGSWWEAGGILEPPNSKV